MTSTDKPGFTPGPWRAGRDLSSDLTSTACWSVLPDNGEKAFKVRICARASEPNAHLIAAALELYETAVMIRDADDDCQRDGLPRIPAAARAKIDAVIAKAEGRT